MTACPTCGGAVDVPPLDHLIVKLIDLHGLSENAEAFLRLLWRGEIVKTVVFLGSLYEDAPDDEPGPSQLYQEVWGALDELRAALRADGSGIDVLGVGWRQGWRLKLPATSSA